jgi:hypothetical protein
MNPKSFIAPPFLAPMGSRVTEGLSENYPLCLIDTAERLRHDGGPGHIFISLSVLRPSRMAPSECQHWIAEHCET